MSLAISSQRVFLINWMMKTNEFIDKHEVLKTSIAIDEPILFMDAVHPTQATKVTCGWIKTGVDKLSIQGVTERD